MRLGGWFGTENIAGLEGLCAALDAHGLSAIGAPDPLVRGDDSEACAAFGARAVACGIVVGEAGMWENLMTSDAALRARRISLVRHMLRQADVMGCRCVVSLAGSRHPSDHPLAHHAANWTEDFRRGFREVVLRILDGLELKRTRFVIEPWCNTFFYQPADIRAFLDSVDHPAVGLHLDQMNLVTQQMLFRTTELIHQTFDLLADRVVAVHLKDIRHDNTHMFLKLDEVVIGEGEMDYHTYLRRLAALPADTPCFCEHFSREEDYLVSFARLHELARGAGVRFLPRTPPDGFLRSCG